MSFYFRGFLERTLRQSDEGRLKSEMIVAAPLPATPRLPQPTADGHSICAGPALIPAATNLERLEQCRAVVLSVRRCRPGSGDRCSPILELIHPIRLPARGPRARAQRPGGLFGNWRWLDSVRDAGWPDCQCFPTGGRNRDLREGYAVHCREGCMTVSYGGLPCSSRPGGAQGRLNLNKVAYTSNEPARRRAASCPRGGSCWNRGISDPKEGVVSRSPRPCAWPARRRAGVRSSARPGRGRWPGRPSARRTATRAKRRMKNICPGEEGRWRRGSQDREGRGGAGQVRKDAAPRRHARCCCCCCATPCRVSAQPSPPREGRERYLPRLEIYAHRFLRRAAAVGFLGAQQSSRFMPQRVAAVSQTLSSTPARRSIGG